MHPDENQANPNHLPEEPMLQFFEFAHLPPHLQAVSGDFYALAHGIVTTLPRNPERPPGAGLLK